MATPKGPSIKIDFGSIAGIVVALGGILGGLLLGGECQGCCTDNRWTHRPRWNPGGRPGDNAQQRPRRRCTQADLRVLSAGLHASRRNR